MDARRRALSTARGGVSLTEGPYEVLGALYVTEDSRAGSPILVERLASALRLPVIPGFGLDYHLQDLASAQRRWREFRSKIDETIVTEAARTSLLAGARATIVGLFGIYEEVHSMHVKSGIAVSGAPARPTGTARDAPI